MISTDIVTTRLIECERVIERGLNTFVEVGAALLEIRDNRLYKDNYSTFEEYLDKRWDMSRPRAYQLIDAAETVGYLSTTVDILPNSERQARPLVGLSPDLQMQVWQEAVKTAPNGKVTGTHVQKIVASHLPDGERGIVFNRTEQGNGIVECGVCSKLYDGSAIDYCPYCAYTQEQRIAYVENKTRPENIHVSDDSYEWYTPEEYINAAHLVMGNIDLDPASCVEANEIVQADEYYTQEDDGMKQDWFGRVWLNPPYNMPNVENFTARAHVLYQNKKIDEAIILVNNSTDSGWFHTLLDNYPVCFTRGRVRYWGPHASQARQGQAIFYLGENKASFIEYFSRFGIVVSKDDN